MIKLKNVSKFYYSKGVIASGFNKINLEFNIGEFVAITGESGSGKSTLLNVISGLDTYEEGEMYIDGKETSHYTEKDFEDYRRKYIGNIFQNFNLVNSYTVYQNVELVLLLNGEKKKNIKPKVLELIKNVGLYKFRNTKVSKLSGGQKQRVGIARALAKDTPIIIADEPTGNLDKKSAEEIIKLLSQISKDKLVIIVTHNYEQVEKYVTRKIKMHDGKVLEDKKIKDANPAPENSKIDYKNITFLNKLRLAFRNTFNIIPKFILIFLIYLFMTVSVISEYAEEEKKTYEASTQGSNYIFNNTSDKRIVIKKNDKSEFTSDDYDKISKLSNVDYIVKNDVLLDYNASFTDNKNYYISPTINELKNFRGKVDLGKMPENDNEVILEGDKDDYYINESILNKDIYAQNYDTGEIDENKKIKIVGIKYVKSAYGNSVVYLSDSLLNDYLYQINQSYSKLKVLFQNKYYDETTENFNIKTNDNVPVNNVYISADLEYSCPKENCINQSLNIEASNLYYTENLSLNVSKVYNKNNMKKLLGLDFKENNGNIYINSEDYNKLFNKGNYQSSVFVKDVQDVRNTISSLEDAGFKTLYIKDTLVTGGYEQITKIMGTVTKIVLIITIFFISYFVINIILKSRNEYFGVIRMLGATKKVSKELLIIELLTVSNLAFFSFMIVIYLNSIHIINLEFINTILTYLNFKDYAILYIVLIMMSYLISQKFSKKLFKKSAISTIKEEV